MKVLIYVGGEDNLSVEQKIASDDTFIRKMESIFSGFLSKKGCIPPITEDVEISLTFVAKEAMAEMNQRYREVEGATDVLSFPMWENEAADFQPPEDWETLQLGDIVVCPEVIAENAAEHNRRFAEEFALVAFHGCLHLIGYDHDTMPRRDDMWREQDTMVAALFARDGETI